MEYTKELLIGTFVKTNTKRQRELAIKFYEKHGLELAPLQYNKESCQCVLISHYQERILCMNMTAVKPEHWKEIDLFYRKRRKFPREMLVSNNKTTWERMIVFAKLKVNNYPYITDDINEGWEKYNGWQYAKEIE